MKNQTRSDNTPSQRREALEADVEAFLKAGNEIQYIDDGVSAQDPQGKGRPLRLGKPSNEAAPPKPADQQDTPSKSSDNTHSGSADSA